MSALPAAGPGLTPDQAIAPDEVAPDAKAAPAGEAAGADQPGSRIDRYDLLKQIGCGGFGVVFLAEQQEPVRRHVALKVLKAYFFSASPEAIARFETERQILPRMDHPNIAKMLDGGTTPNGEPYSVMELVEGQPITEYCDTTAFGSCAMPEIFAQVCEAVHHAHQKGIIHCDLKPSNILVSQTDPDQPAVPKVIDFGIAKAAVARLALPRRRATRLWGNRPAHPPT